MKELKVKLNHIRLAREKIGYIGVSPQRIALFIAYLKHKGADKDYIPIPFWEIKRDLGLDPRTTSLLKQGLSRHGIVEVIEGESRKGPLGAPTRWKLNMERIKELENGLKKREEEVEARKGNVSLVKLKGKYAVVKSGTRIGIFTDREDALEFFNLVARKEG